MIEVLTIAQTVVVDERLVRLVQMDGVPNDVAVLIDENLLAAGLQHVPHVEVLRFILVGDLRYAWREA